MNGNPQNPSRSQSLRRMAQEALDSLGEVDLDHIPVERIAEKMGISRATFFRHFRSKDDLVVLAFTGDVDEFAARLPPGSIHPGQPVWPALRQVFEPLIEATETDGPALRRRLMLLRDRPSISTRLRRARGPQIEALAAALAAEGLAPEAAATLAGAAVLSIDRCIGLWATTPGANLRPMVEQTFFHLARGY